VISRLATLAYTDPQGHSAIFFAKIDSNPGPKAYFKALEGFRSVQAELRVHG